MKLNGLHKTKGKKMEHKVSEVNKIYKNTSVKTNAGYLHRRTKTVGYFSNCSCGSQIVTNVNSEERHSKAIAKHIKVGA